MSGNAFAIGHAIRPFPGEVRSGDQVFVRADEAGAVVALVDAVGHGTAAAGTGLRVVRVLGDIFDRQPDADLGSALTALHADMTGGRGASITLARYEAATGSLAVVAVGNTVARVIGPGRSKSLLSRDGNLGHILPSPRLETSRLVPGGMLLIYSDGVKSQFDFEALPQRHTAPPDALARTILDHHGKDHDDSSVLILKRARVALG